MRIQIFYTWKNYTPNGSKMQKFVIFIYINKLQIEALVIDWFWE